MHELGCMRECLFQKVIAVNLNENRLRKLGLHSTGFATPLFVCSCRLLLLVLLRLITGLYTPSIFRGLRRIILVLW
jgi:hypothetical protein